MAAISFFQNAGEPERLFVRGRLLQKKSQVRGRETAFRAEETAWFTPQGSGTDPQAAGMECSMRGEPGHIGEAQPGRHIRARYLDAIVRCRISEKLIDILAGILLVVFRVLQQAAADQPAH